MDKKNIAEWDKEIFLRKIGFAIKYAQDTENLKNAIVAFDVTSGEVLISDRTDVKEFIECIDTAWNSKEEKE